MSEQQEQCAFASWFRVQYPQHAKLMNIVSIGENVGARRMSMLKRMGLSPGYPDIMIFLPRDGFHGMLIELKTSKGRLQKNQVEIHEILKAQGYFVVTCYGWGDAVEATKRYIDGKQ
jgi:hypothetical protein